MVSTSASWSGCSPAFTAKRQYLAERRDIDVVDDVVDRLHELSHADIAAMGRCAPPITSRYGFACPKQLRAATEHHGERALLRPQGHSGDRAVGVGHSCLPGPLREKPGCTMIHGRGVDDGPWACRSGQSRARRTAPRPLPCPSARRGRSGRRLSASAAASAAAVAPLPRQRLDRLRKIRPHTTSGNARLQEVPGHSGAHAAESDKNRRYVRP